MRRRVSKAAACMAWSQFLYSQALLVDQKLPETAIASGPAFRLESTGAGFEGDHFQIGSKGEVWVIDRIRTWVAGDAREIGPRKLGDLYGQITLFGGIEAEAPAPGQPPPIECDCHNLTPLISAPLQPGSDSPLADRLRVSLVGTNLWQIDFSNLSWSVPGGVFIQFGIQGRGRLAVGGGGGRLWSNAAMQMNTTHSIKLFDEKGKLLGPDSRYASDRSVGMNVQVWGHKLATVSIRPLGTWIDVVLKSSASLDAAQTDVSTLHFGPRGASPVSSQLESAAGSADLVARFRASETGIAPTALNACLRGAQKDGVPFEGCDLMKRPSQIQ